MANKVSAEKTWRKILDSGIVGTVSRRDIRNAAVAVKAEREATSGKSATQGDKTTGRTSTRK